MTAPTDRTLPLTAAVLAGGRSMRMGVDKTLLDVDGRALVARVVDAVGEVCANTLVVTNRPEALGEAELPSSVRILQDEIAYQGPLGGLVTALAETTDEWMLAVAADMPHLTSDVIRALWDLRGDADAVVPVGDKGPEPLLALYRVAACLPVAREVLATGRRRPVAIFSRVQTVEVPADALRAVDPDLRSLTNVNTPADLLDARDTAAENPRYVRGGVKLEVLEVSSRRSTRSMPSETPVTIHLNDREIATTQATPHDLEDLAAGFLLSEGLLVDRDALVSIDADAKRGLVWVTSTEDVPADIGDRTRYLTSGCGRGVTFASVADARGLAPIESALRVSADDLYDLVGAMARRAEMYRDSGGVHACGLARGNELLIVREDVGRHNALDKVLGRAWLDRVPTTDAILLSTGRISYEMTVKAGKSRVPIAVSRSAVTDLAADVAAGLNITLVGYARGGKLTVYTVPERVIASAEEE
ncbi:MAG: formate dehydrogenase accessory sulfurtransferase FdhD [Coriobacteriia bacterium]|nr:formate dehydrogenase accessory sulfurtransferase FdhD [Coriobacteriia bacterium]